MVHLPPPLTPGRYRIGMVCLGNICRSPSADVVLNSLLADFTAADVTVTSCGTADWHVGKPMDPRSAATLAAAGYDPSQHRAQNFGPDWFDYDLLLAMDGHNLADIRALLPTHTHERTLLFRSFDPEVSDRANPPSVPDPYYGGDEGFKEVLAMVERTSQGILAALNKLFAPAQ